ncbi:hypothetical protein [Dactylosporangium sp. NPDC050588]|uniref:hypothetical protein n=1 Tax=Dactylosporangium sp. NPDC050588 TaxID=3157211 RepID=UPI0033E7458E
MTAVRVAGPVAAMRPDVLLIGRPAMAIVVRTLGGLEWFAILAGSSCRTAAAAQGRLTVGRAGWLTVPGGSSGH